jgi:RimJ/RimL family protein N-acetyltransferase
MFRIIPEHEMKKTLAEKLKKAEEKRNAYYFAIRKKEDSALIGFACIGWTIPAHQVGGIQIDFGEEADLVKYGDETMRLMLRYGFMEAGLHRLMATFPTHETEQIALFERSGFLREVQHREAAYHAGRYWDKVEYALLKPEYKKKYHEEAK